MSDSYRAGHLQAQDVNVTPYHAPSSTCQVCGSPPRAPRSYLCARCYDLLDKKASERTRGWKPDREAGFRALQRQWRGDLDGFACHFTGLKMEEADSTSPLYRTWEHLEPGNSSEAALACAFVNHMKTSLTERDFRSVVLELALAIGPRPTRISIRVSSPAVAGAESSNDIDVWTTLGSQRRAPQQLPGGRLCETIWNESCSDLRRWGGR
jgi:hypothetical protein